MRKYEITIYSRSLDFSQLSASDATGRFSNSSDLILSQSKDLDT